MSVIKNDEEQEKNLAGKEIIRVNCNKQKLENELEITTK